MHALWLYPLDFVSTAVHEWKAKAECYLHDFLLRVTHPPCCIEFAALSTDKYKWLVSTLVLCCCVDAKPSITIPLSISCVFVLLTLVLILAVAHSCRWEPVAITSFCMQMTPLPATLPVGYSHQGVHVHWCKNQVMECEQLDFSLIIQSQTSKIRCKKSILWHVPWILLVFLLKIRSECVENFVASWNLSLFWQILFIFHNSLGWRMVL